MPNLLLLTLLVLSVLITSCCWLIASCIWNMDNKSSVKEDYLSLACYHHNHRRPDCYNMKAVFFSSSPEPKAQVSYCHSAPSVVRPSVCRPSSVRRPSVNFHIFNFFSRIAWWILMKLGRDEVFMVPYKCCCFSDRSAQGRIQGGAKIGHGGSPSSRIFFFRLESYSNKPNG